MSDLRFSNSGWSLAISALVGSAISYWLYLESPLIGAIWGIFVFGSIAMLVDFLHNLPFAKWNAVGWVSLAAAGYFHVVLYPSSPQGSIEYFYYMTFGWAVVLIIGGLFLGQVLPSWLSNIKSFATRLPGNSGGQMVSRTLLFLVVASVSCVLMTGVVRMKEREENLSQCANQMAYEAAKYDGLYVDPLGVEYKRTGGVGIVSSWASEPIKLGHPSVKDDAKQITLSKQYLIRCIVRRQSGVVDHFVQKFTGSVWTPVNPQSR
jgi:hypothetical protein